MELTLSDAISAEEVTQAIESDWEENLPYGFMDDPKRRTCGEWLADILKEKKRLREKAEFEKRQLKLFQEGPQVPGEIR